VRSCASFFTAERLRIAFHPISAREQEDTAT
jgi:hypothetical protein